MATVHNHDVDGICRRVERFRKELFHTVSSGVSEVNAHDRERLVSYLNALRAYHAWVIGQPQLDLPETHPRSYEVEDTVEYPQVENENVNDCLRLMALMRDEMLNSQSAREPSGLNKFDSGRLVMILDKADAFIATYVDVSTPLDLPESSPKTTPSGPGRTGLNP